MYIDSPELFMSRGCRRCEASAHEVVVVHHKWAATKQPPTHPIIKVGSPEREKMSI
jgi:hypothetical protein